MTLEIGQHVLVTRDPTHPRRGVVSSLGWTSYGTPLYAVAVKDGGATYHENCTGGDLCPLSDPVPVRGHLKLATVDGVRVSP